MKVVFKISPYRKCGSRNNFNNKLSSYSESLLKSMFKKWGGITNEKYTL